MGFVIGSGKEKMQEKAISGHIRKVAVGCWFTSSGRGIPQMIKFERDDGTLQTVKDICILKSEQKYYAGILSCKYWCRAFFKEKERQFLLFYYPETNCWDLVFPEEAEQSLWTDTKNVN